MILGQSECTLDAAVEGGGRALCGYLALPLTKLLSLDIRPAPLSLAGAGEGAYMAGYTARKGRDDAPLDAIASF